MQGKRVRFQGVAIQHNDVTTKNVEKDEDEENVNDD